MVTAPGIDAEFAVWLPFLLLLLSSEGPTHLVAAVKACSASGCCVQMSGHFFSGEGPSPVWRSLQERNEISMGLELFSPGSLGVVFICWLFLYIEGIYGTLGRERAQPFDTHFLFFVSWVCKTTTKSSGPLFGCVECVKASLTSPCAVQ